MWKRIQEFFQAWSGMKEFNSLGLDDRDIVFYSEDNASWVHFEPIIKELLEKHDQGFCYLTSSIDDRMSRVSKAMVPRPRTSAGMSI